VNRLSHEWDDDACCIYCGFDGAEDHWLKSRLRLEIGNEEFNYRRAAGDFDAGRFCPKREEH